MTTSVPIPPARPIPPRWRRAVPLFTVMPAIALLLSGVITWINLGAVDGFVGHWLRAFAMALPVLPLGLLTMVLIDRVLAPRLRDVPWLLAGVLLALCTASVMETLMATVVTLSNHGLTPGFGSRWATAFLHSLPVGLCIGMLMSFVVKPRLARWVAAS